MKIGIKDAKTIELLDLYGFKAVIFEGDHEIGVSLKTKEANYDVATGFDYERNSPSFTDRVIAILKTLVPPAGTENSEMTDEQKGMIQLLFEIEKAIA